MHSYSGLHSFNPLFLLGLCSSLAVVHTCYAGNGIDPEGARFRQYGHPHGRLRARAGARMHAGLCSRGRRWGDGKEEPGACDLWPGGVGVRAG